ncbi:MAG: NADH-quinone oxidoreductase subunit C [Spirochaetia bacterium]|nr:NADH-quinone oxidoreductase subunit C [Spirochaetia bacterium]
MNFALPLLEKLKQEMTSKTSEIIQADSKMPILKIEAKDIREAVKKLHDDPAFDMKYLNCISGLHLTQTKEDGTLDLLGFEVLYVFSSARDFSTIAVRVDLPEKNPAIDTIDDLYGSANWFEREVYDLLGVNFINSSDLRRIMLPQDWEGHPLRKDYKEQASYNGMPTTRPNEMESIRIE